MRIQVDGTLGFGVTAKDVILAIIGRIGTAGGTGYTIEYAGNAIRGLSMEGRMDRSEDVLKLSRADSGAALKTAMGGSKGAKAAQERVKALEEELTAREKALQEANDRVAMLEKSVQDMNTVARLSGLTL